MIVKIMHGNVGDDEHPQAAYRLFDDVQRVDFSKPSDDGHTRPYAYLKYYDKTEDQIQLYGNVYVMTDEGKTFDRFEVQP